MKKVGIITFHFVNNFGGNLQAYALRRVVEQKCNTDAELIDYRNWFIRFTDTVRLLPITTNFAEIKSGIKTMGQRLGRRRKFINFTKENNKLSRRYINHWQLNANPPGDDKYICGSDQIWNPFLTCGLSHNYFLRFEANPDNKIAYAPSFGTSGVEPRYQKKLDKYLNEIGHLSVRETSGQTFIKDLSNRDAIRVIDPTFLLTKEEWEAVGKNPLKSDEPYMLLYIMQRDDEMYGYAKKLKEKLGIKVVEISRYGYQPGFVDETLIDVGPDEFLGLFRDAAYVCTNSYHGLAFSVIFQKELCLVPCKRFRARISNLIDLLHIDISSCQDDDSLIANYDKVYVQQNIEKERKKALSYLNESLGLNE